MAKRKFVFENGEFYHIYNCDADKRIIIEDIFGVFRFLQGTAEERQETKYSPAGLLLE